MTDWSWNRKRNKDEAQPPPQAEASFSRPSDFEKEPDRYSEINDENFEYFYLKYFNMIHRFIAHKINDFEIAQDITQNVFSVALDKIDDFRDQGYSVGSWLFGIARNQKAMEGRCRRSRHEVSWDPDYHDSEDPARPDDNLCKSDDDRILRHCIDELAPIRGEVLTAHYWNGLKVREIALAMEMSESNVKNHLQRGRKQLRYDLLKNGLERGLSAEKIKWIRESMLKEEGWNLLEGEDPESS